MEKTFKKRLIPQYTPEETLPEETKMTHDSPQPMLDCFHKQQRPDSKCADSTFKNYCIESPPNMSFFDLLHEKRINTLNLAVLNYFVCCSKTFTRKMCAKLLSLYKAYKTLYDSFICSVHVTCYIIVWSLMFVKSKLLRIL